MIACDHQSSKAHVAETVYWENYEMKQYLK